MARDQTRRPVTDAELEDAREAIEEQREEIHDYLESEGVDTDE